MWKMEHRNLEHVKQKQWENVKQKKQKTKPTESTTRHNKSTQVVNRKTVQGGQLRGKWRRQQSRSGVHLSRVLSVSLRHQSGWCWHDVVDGRGWAGVRNKMSAMSTHCDVLIKELALCFEGQIFTQRFDWIELSWLTCRVQRVFATRLHIILGWGCLNRISQT